MSTDKDGIKKKELTEKQLDDASGGVRFGKLYDDKTASDPRAVGLVIRGTCPSCGGDLTAHQRILEGFGVKYEGICLPCFTHWTAKL